MRVETYIVGNEPVTHGLIVRCSPPSSTPDSSSSLDTRMRDFPLERLATHGLTVRCSPLFGLAILGVITASYRVNETSSSFMRPFFGGTLYKCICKDCNHFNSKKGNAVIYKNRIRGELREQMIAEIQSQLHLPETDDEQAVLDYLVAFADAHPEYAQRAISDAAGIRDCVLYYERNGCKHGQSLYLAHRQEVIKAIKDLFPNVSDSVGLCEALKRIHERGLVCSRYLLRDLLVENGYTYHVRPKKRGSIYRATPYRNTNPIRRTHESNRI